MSLTPAELLDFWFSPEARARWFASTPEFDELVRRRYLELWQRAQAGELADWEAGSAGALALVILLDQFPLHMFRNQAQAWSCEAQAREVARRAIAAGHDGALAPERRGFLYLPFMHSESPADQETSVDLYRGAGLEQGLKWALHHRELIRRFGRFPHRNAALGRASTDAELAYLSGEEAFHG